MGRLLGVGLMVVGAIMGCAVVFAVFSSAYRTARFWALWDAPGRLASVDPFTWAVVLTPVLLMAAGIALVVATADGKPDSLVEL